MSQLLKHPTASLQEFAPTWSATRPDGSPVKVCALHLMADDLHDVAPTSGKCAICTQPGRITSHLLERWQERFASRVGAEEAGRAIVLFVDGARTVDPPSWARVALAPGHELLANEDFPDVVLVKKCHARGGVPALLTCLTPDSHLRTKRARFGLATSWGKV